MKNKIKDSKGKSKEAVKIESNDEPKEEVPLGDQNHFDKSLINRESMSSTAETFPKDTCFYANPNIVVFDVRNFISTFLRVDEPRHSTIKSIKNGLIIS